MSSSSGDTDEERVRAQVQGDQGELTLLDLNPTIPVSSEESDGEVVEAVSPDDQGTGTAPAETWFSPARISVPSAASTGSTTRSCKRESKRGSTVRGWKGKTTGMLRPVRLYVDSEGPFFVMTPTGPVVKIRPMWRSLPVLHWALVNRRVGRRKGRGRIGDPVPRLGQNSGPVVAQALDGEVTVGRIRHMIETSQARSQSRSRVPINVIENPRLVEAPLREQVRRESLAEDVPKMTVRRRMRGKQAPTEERARL
jgi:hypothetical protein